MTSVVLICGTFTAHQHGRVQAVDDDSVGDDAVDEENDELVSICRI